jgi:hypothetical protein
MSGTRRELTKDRWPVDRQNDLSPMERALVAALVSAIVRELRATEPCGMGRSAA